MKRTGICLRLAVLLAGAGWVPARAGAADWWESVVVTTEGSVNWVNNLSRTSDAPTRKNGSTYELSLGAIQHRQLARDWFLHTGVEAALFGATKYDLAGRIDLGPQVGLQRKFGLGPLAPTLQFDAAATYRAARFSGDRGWTVKTGLHLAKRFTPSFRAGLGGQWLEHYARSATFDLQQHSFFVEAAWDINARWSLSGSAGRTSGDIVANAAGAVWAQAISGGFGPEIFDYYTARPWETTNVYGPGWVSYNVEADVDLWSLKATYAVSRQTMAEIRYQSAFSVNYTGIRYPSDSWGLAFAHRF